MLAGGIGRGPTTTVLKLGHVGIRSFTNPATLVPSPGIRTGFVWGVAFGSFKDSPRDPSVQPGMRTSAQTQTVCVSYAPNSSSTTQGYEEFQPSSRVPGSTPMGHPAPGRDTEDQRTESPHENGTSVVPSTLLGRRDSHRLWVSDVLSEYGLD